MMPLKVPCRSRRKEALIKKRKKLEPPYVGSYK